jgi:hypothetical protein
MGSSPIPMKLFPSTGRNPGQRQAVSTRRPPGRGVSILRRGVRSPAAGAAVFPLPFGPTIAIFSLPRSSDAPETASETE